MKLFKKSVRFSRLTLQAVWPGLVLLVAVMAVSVSSTGPGWALPPDRQYVADRIRGQLELSAEETAWLEAHRTIRVGVDPDFAPFSFRGPSGRYHGIVPDLLDILSAALGVTFRIEPGLTWTEILQQAEERRIDLVATATIRPERELYLEFTDFHIPTPVVIMSRRGEEERLLGPSGLTGKQVAVVRGYAIGRRIREENPGIITHMVETPLEGLQAVAAGEAEAYVGILAVNTYLSRENGLTNLSVAGRYDLTPAGQRFAIRKDWPVLTGILDKAMALMAPSQRLALLEDWSASGMGAAQSAERLSLSARERDHLIDRKEVGICVEPDNLPYERIDSEGSYTGMAADFMTMFTDMLGLGIRLVPVTDRAEAEDFIAREMCDVIPLVQRPDLPPEHLAYTDPFLDVPVVLAATVDRFTYLDGLKALGARRLAVASDAPYLQRVQRQFPDVTIVETQSAETALSMVAAGEVDAALGSVYRLSMLIRKMGLTEVKIAGHTDFVARHRMALRRDDMLLTQAFRKAVTARAADAESRILQKWTSVHLEPPLDYTLLWKGLALLAAILCFVMYRHVVMERHNRELWGKNQALELLSRTDSLTGIFNRLRVEEVLSYEIRQAQRYGHGLAVILVDIDRFKVINDSRGHQAGDQVLIRFSRLVEKHIRESDTFARWGGEEFLIVCPDTGAEEAQVIAEKLRQLIQTSVLVEDDEVTASFGVACFRSDDSKQSLIARADEGLYRAKEAGRNRVETD